MDLQKWKKDRYRKADVTFSSENKAEFLYIRNLCEKSIAEWKKIELDIKTDIPQRDIRFLYTHSFAREDYTLNRNKMTSPSLTI